MKIQSTEIVCPECEAKKGDWCKEILTNKVRPGYLLMHTSRVKELQIVKQTDIIK
jgi:hypothetical protein